MSAMIVNTEHVITNAIEAYEGQPSGLFSESYRVGIISYEDNITQLNMQDDCLDEWGEVRFMFACFILLMAGEKI